MTNEEAIQKTQDFLKQKFSAESSGHDYAHMQRVWSLAKTIAKDEDGVDMFTLELAALLHDVADWKFHGGSEEAGPAAAREWLESIGVDEKIILHIQTIIRQVSFKGAGVASHMDTIEGKIVHDADKLDAIGAIGIARTFAYGASKGTAMYDPDIKPVMHGDFEQYKKNESSTINHFYEKLLLLKDRMLTKTGKSMAEHRHKVLENFLDEFIAEWEGRA